MLIFSVWFQFYQKDFLYRQNLFSGYEERKIPENTESISEEEIENLIDTIDLEEWYKTEKELKLFEDLDNKSEASIQTHKGFMADDESVSGVYNQSYDYHTENYNLGFPPRQQILTPFDNSKGENIKSCLLYTSPSPRD